MNILDKNRYLLNSHIDRYNKKVFRIYELLAKLAIQYGCHGDRSANYTNQQVESVWSYNLSECPSIHSIKPYARTSVTKWMIRNKIVVNHSIWTSDFLHGLAQNGVIRWHSKNFPSLKWYNNDVLSSLIKNCPYGGNLGPENQDGARTWHYVPAFYLPFSPIGMDYIAGVLSGGKKTIRGGKIYAKYTFASKYISAVGIPIEHTVNKNGRFKYILISPFWPALFSYRMPKEIGDTWLGIENTAYSNTYAAILWLAYIGTNFINDRLPYLDSRRKIFYDLKCEDGAMTRLQKMRVEKNMTQLDNRFKEAVMYWKNKDNGATESK